MSTKFCKFCCMYFTIKNSKEKALKNKTFRMVTFSALGRNNLQWSDKEH